MELSERNQIISEAIKRKAEVIKTFRDKVKLTDTDQVMKRTSDYFDECVASSCYPSISGLCSSFGISRQALYYYMRDHDDDTTAFLASVHDTIADILQDGALKNATNPVASIFLLKNMGYSDKSEITIDGGIREVGPSTTSLIDKYKSITISDYNNNVLPSFNNDEL